MVDVSTKDPVLEWRRYCPSFGGWNADLAEDDRWYVEIRRSATRRSVVEVSLLMAQKRDEMIIAAEGSGKRSKEEQSAFEDEILSEIIEENDGEAMMISQYVRGPFKLSINGDKVTSITEMLRVFDSQELMSEILGELRALGLLSGADRGNSPAPSGGDTPSPDGADPEAQEKESPPVVSA